MLGFLIAFIVKAPMVPVHTWLPTATEQSTPGTSVLLVGILDKIGTFGMIRFCLGLFPEASQWVAPVMIVLALISIIYGAVAAIGSTNLLRLVAYTSISHFGFMVLGIYTFTSAGISGSIFYMLNHGFSTAALFLVLGFLITRRGSALVGDYGGVQKVAPVLTGVFLMAGLSGLALPGMSSFVSEFMVLAGTWSRQPVVGAVATLGTVLAAVYILLMFQRTMTGPVTAATAEHFTDRRDGAGEVGGGAADRRHPAARLPAQHRAERHRADSATDPDPSECHRPGRAAGRGSQVNTLTPPTFEWLQLAPVLTVLLAACLGIVIEALVPRRWRFVSQIALFEVAVLVAFVFLVISWRLPADSMGLMAMGSISLDGPTYLMWGSLLVFGLLSLLRVLRA